MMKKKHIYIYLLGMLLFSVGCTGKFREFNTDQSGITDDDLLIDDNGFGIRLGIIQQGIYFNYDFGKGKNWPFQLIQNLNADMFSGYMHDGKPLNGGTHNSDYNMQDGWNSAMWTHMYSYIFPQIYQSENATRDTEPALFGITKVLKVEVMHRVTDYYGPVIYKNFANAQNQYRPDTQKEVYYEFFNELDSAVVSLADYIDKKPDSNGFTRFDILLDGQYSSWIKFANSLRMRLAMRISAVDPDKARAEFRKGLENEFGVFEAEAERVAVSTKSGFTNPLGELNRVWNETYMSAAMESILTGYDDPRLKVYFETCTDKAYAGEYRGIRQGTCFAHNHYAGLSKLSVDQSTDAPLMSSAEVWFLRAEAALRGWIPEDEEECYLNGIKASLHQHGIYQMDDYLNSERTAADFILFFNRCKNKYLRMSSIVFGLCLGYGLAFALGKVNMSALNVEMLMSFNIPQPFKYGIDFNISSFIAIGLVYLITAIEATGDVTANSMISGLPIEGDSYLKRVSGGVMADGFNSLLAGIFNSFPNSIFAQNNGIIQLTGVASRYVGYYIAAMLVLLGLFPIVGAIFSLMPDPVLGGATLLMFGTVAAAGIRIVSSQEIGRKETLVLAVSLSLGLGVELMPDVLKQAPEAIRSIFSSGITTGGLTAIVANMVIRVK